MMVPHPPPPNPTDRVDAPPPSPEEADGPTEAAARRGDIVRVTTFDTARQVDVVRHGLVVEVVDAAVRVAWLDDVSHPIALDPPESGRVDVPRVERLEV